ncbi:MAG TPA: tetratricopeptide repeat protein [Myxococcales bacterium LLY-WYZ-16_1]|nr:tetratricopeptide repeat protein [Myxococcales bacterium LLY-WYZ-16_1]
MKAPEFANRCVGPVLAVLLALPISAQAQLPGTAGFQTQNERKEELIAKLRRDISKVAHSVEVTQELIARSRGAPFLPDIYLRLAELYVEQARYEFYLVHEERGERAKGSAVAPTAKLLKEKAIETYQRILVDFPDYEGNDQVLFFMAHEYRELGMYDEMIQTYERLVSKYPQSELVLDAYLVLGDYRFDKQDLRGAKGYYQKIIDAPRSSTHPMAHFKMGWVHLNELDYRSALVHFERAVETADANEEESGGPKAEGVNVKREALVDLAYAYPEVKKPRRALRYFRRLSSSRTMYLVALEKLAKRYFIKQEYDAAARIYREIARLSHNAENNLDYTGRIYEAAKKSGNYTRVHRDVDAMLTALDSYRFDWRVAETQRDGATKDFEVFARDLSTKAQANLLKKSPKRYGQRVAAAYRRYLQSFPDDDNYPDIVQNLADTLFDSKQFILAGDRYEEATQYVEGDRKLLEENLYAACAAFHQALRKGTKLSRFDRMWAQQGLIRNGIAYVESFPKSDKVATIKLNIGKSYFEGGDFEKAVGIFEEFIASYPTHEDATAAAELILDAYAQQQDYAGMSEAAKKLAQNQQLGDASFRRRLVNTARSAEERQIGEVILTASVDREAGTDAGEQLRKYWESNRDSPVAEKTLYTAFVQYKEARDFDKTFETGNQFIGAYPESEYLGDVFGTLASFTTQTGDYEEASVYLEEFYKKFPRDAAAQRMLAQSANIKQLIGDHRGAIAAYQELLGKTRDPNARAEYARQMLDSYEALSDWDGMKAAARDVLQQNGQSVKGFLALGLAHEKTGDMRPAIDALQRAVRLAGRSSSQEDQADAARAAFLLGDVVFKEYRSVAAGSDVQAAVQAKADLLGQLEETMVDAVGFNQGEWAVAALHRVALAYQDFANFLESAPVPVELSEAEAEQYQQLVAQQSSAIREKSDQYFETCTAKARQLKVFTGPVLGCLARSEEPRLPPVQTAAAAPSPQEKDELQKQLTENPKDVNAIAKLADFFLSSNQPAKAKLMASRGIEIDDREPRFHNQMGMADLLLGKPQEAYYGFRRAADLAHPYAAANLAALMAEFGDYDAAAAVVDQADLDDLPPAAPDLHPEAIATLEQVRP